MHACFRECANRTEQMHQTLRHAGLIYRIAGMDSFTWHVPMHAVPRSDIHMVLKLIDHWDNHAATFFTPFVFTLGTLGMNISVNSLGAGNDMTAQWARYINIQRGQVRLIYFLAAADRRFCPWETHEVHVGIWNPHPRQE